MSESAVPSTDRDPELREAVIAIRRKWRTRRVLEGAPAIVAAALVALLVGLALRSALGSPAAIITATRVVGYVLLALVAAWCVVLPAVRRANDEQIALYVEEQAPELRQVFLSAVHELHQPVAAGASAALRERVIARALDEYERLEQGAAIERPRARRALVRLGALTVTGALLVALGPTAIRDIARILFVPWSRAVAASPPSLSVSPGSIRVPRGAAVDVAAELRALTDRGAEIVLRIDSANSWTRIPMAHDSTGARYLARLFDINQNTVYYVEAGGLRSPQYRITVTDLPTVKQLALELHFPAYTGLPPRKTDSGGDVAAVIGTVAVLDIASTLPVTGGSLQFDDGATVRLRLGADGHLGGSFRVMHDGFYRVDLVAADGSTVPGTVQHSVEALLDHPPQVRIDKPGRDTRVTSVEEVPMQIRASDDYGVRDVQLHYTVNGGPDRVVALSDSARRGSIDFSAVHTMFLEEMSLHAGDLVAYHATARDGAGNAASSDIYFMEVRPFGRDYHAADDNAGGGGGGGNHPGQFTQRQRELVAGTFNWQRDSASTPERDRRANATTLAIAQGKLQSDVAAQANQMAARNIVQADSGFAVVQAELDSAAKAMKPAEDGLGRRAMNDAIPAQEQALQHLQAADAAYRDITVRRGSGGGGGGGGGGGANAQDLADLFELQTDKLKNQYEAPRTAASSGAQQALDSTQEKLKELAARQQQENERQQRMADALRQRLGQQGAGPASNGQPGAGQPVAGQQPGQSGGSGTPAAPQRSRTPSGAGTSGSAQRELARQVEAQARQLEKLSRDQNSAQLADAARRLQESADAMRQAATGAPQQGTTALDRLRQAAQSLEGAQTAAQGRAIQSLARRAAQLGRQQQEIGRDVAGLQTMTPGQQDQQATGLAQRKDSLAEAVRQLGADAERFARETRRDQPKAAAAAQTAANDIRDRRVLEQIDASKRIMRAGSPEYSRSLEGVIGETLDSVASRLAAAAGSVGTRRGEQQALALDKTRDLVRDLESLRDRTLGEAATRPGSGQPAQGTGSQPVPGRSATGGQPGQRGESRQGQSGQGGQQPGRSGPGNANRAPPSAGTSARPLGSGVATGGGDPRQFRGEVGARIQAAEGLRRDLAAQGVDIAPLDHAIGQLRRLQDATDPGRADELQSSIVAGLKDFEFDVWRKFNGDAGARPALGAATQVPPQYRAMVEEYYRSLARKGPK